MKASRVRSRRLMDVDGLLWPRHRSIVAYIVQSAEVQRGWAPNTCSLLVWTDLRHRQGIDASLDMMAKLNGPISCSDKADAPPS